MSTYRRLARKPINSSKRNASGIKPKTLLGHIGSIILMSITLAISISTMPTVSAQQNSFSGSLSRSYIVQLDDDASLEVLRTYSVGYASQSGFTSTDHSGGAGAADSQTGGTSVIKPPGTPFSSADPKNPPDPKSSGEGLSKGTITPKAPWAQANQAWTPDQDPEHSLVASSSQRIKGLNYRNIEESAEDSGRKRPRRESVEQRGRKWEELGFETPTNGLIEGSQDQEGEDQSSRDRYHLQGRHSSIRHQDNQHLHTASSSSHGFLDRKTSLSHKHSSSSYAPSSLHPHQSPKTNQRKETLERRHLDVGPPLLHPVENSVKRPSHKARAETGLTEPETQAAEKGASYSLIQAFLKRSGIDLLFEDQHRPDKEPQNRVTNDDTNGSQETNSMDPASSTSVSASAADQSIRQSDSHSDSSQFSTRVMSSNSSTGGNVNSDSIDSKVEMANNGASFLASSPSLGLQPANFASLPTYEGGGFALPDASEDTASSSDPDISWNAAWPMPYPYFTIRHEFKHKKIFFGMSVTLTKPVTTAQNHKNNNEPSDGDTGLSADPQASNPNVDVPSSLEKIKPDSISSAKSEPGAASKPDTPQTGFASAPGPLPISDIALLRSLPGVKAVYPVRYVPRPRPHGSAVLLAGPAQAKGAIEEAKNTLSMTGVEALHRHGIDGRGVRVAVLDTGVDYNHPALGGCFGKGCKIAFGRDLVGDWYDGTNDPVSGPDPHSECGPHGTHVLGIIGAHEKKGQGIGLKGASPGATLGMFRVFGCQGGAADDMLMKGMELAWESEAEVISVSIGAPAGWPDSPTAIMASNVALHGRVIAIAAGNDGSTGMFFPSSPAVGRDVLSVGSIDNAYFTVFNLTVDSGDYPSIEYFASQPFYLPDLPIFVTSTDSPPSEKDACDPFPDWYPNLGSFIVLIRRGGCGFLPKFVNAANAGARFVLVYNPTEAMTPIYVEPMGGILKAGLIGARDGTWLVEQYLQGVPVRLSFPATTFSVSNKYTGGTVSSFTSYGPTFDLASVTALSAPGGHILSTWPVADGNYSIASGTSMATPFAAAAAALLIQASREGKTPPGQNGTLTAMEIVARLSTTCKPAYNATKAALLETVAKQGSGLLQVSSAVSYQTTVAPSTLYLNDTTNWNRLHAIKVTNHGSNTLNYVAEHEPAGTALTFPKGTGAIYHNRGPVPLVEPHVTATMKPRIFSLEPGASQTMTVTLDFPGAIDPQTFPVLSGFIRISSSTPILTSEPQYRSQMSWTGLTSIESQGVPAESLTVSYFGLGAPQNTAHMLDTKNGATKSYALPAVVVAKSGKPQRLPRSYSFSGGDVPVLQFRLVSGSRRTRVDVVQDVAEVDGQEDPQDTANQAQGNINEEGAQSGLRRIGDGAGDAENSIISTPDDVAPDSVGTGEVNGGGGADDGGLGPGVPVQTTRIVGRIATTAWLARNSLDAAYGIYAVAWDGTAGGADVQRGNYRILLRTERLGWTPPKGEDGESSPYDGDEDQTGKEVNPGGEENGKRWEYWLSPIIRVDRAFVNNVDI